MKISIVTAVYNRVSTISVAVDSIKKQSYPDIEHIVVDGASTDGTLDILRAQLSSSSILISESDNGIYNALNKGLKLATGEIIGIMHSDDFYADNDVLSVIHAAFRDDKVDIVYGDLEYVSKSNVNRVIRCWKAGIYRPSRLVHGWMPPHPTVFLRRSILERYGLFDETYRISGDYDALLRYLTSEGVCVSYIPRILVKMRAGGESNKSFSNIFLKSKEDLRALRKNNVGGFYALICKNLLKIIQLRI